jgi:hypothetical protein
MTLPDATTRKQAGVLLLLVVAGVLPNLLVVLGSSHCSVGDEYEASEGLER